MLLILEDITTGLETRRIPVGPFIFDKNERIRGTDHTPLATNLDKIYFALCHNCDKYGIYKYT